MFCILFFCFMILFFLRWRPPSCYRLLLSAAFTEFFLFGNIFTGFCIFWFFPKLGQSLPSFCPDVGCPGGRWCEALQRRFLFGCFFFFTEFFFYFIFFWYFIFLVFFSFCFFFHFGAATSFETKKKRTPTAKFDAQALAIVDCFVLFFFIVGGLFVFVFFRSLCSFVIAVAMCPEWVSLGFIGFYWILLNFTGFYWVLLGFTGFYWVLLGYTRLYWVILGFTYFYRVFLSFSRFYWILLGFTGFHWVLLGFTKFYLVFLDLTGLYWFLPSFNSFWHI